MSGVATTAARTPAHARHELDGTWTAPGRRESTGRAHAAAAAATRVSGRVGEFLERTRIFVAPRARLSIKILLYAVALLPVPSGPESCVLYVP